MNDRNSEIISRADSGGTLRVTSGPRCGASLRKISAVATFFVRLASTDRTSSHSLTASARLRSTVARSVANDRKQPSRRSVESDETIGVIVTVSRGACARNASVRSGQLRIEMPPRAKSPQNGRAVHAPAAVVGTPDDDQLVGQHVVRVGRLARQRRLAGAAAPGKHDADLGVAQAAAVDQHPADARQDRRVEDAQHAVDRIGVHLAARAAAVADRGRRAAALGGQLHREVPSLGGDRPPGRGDRQRMFFGLGPPARRPWRRRRRERDAQRDVAFDATARPASRTRHSAHAAARGTSAARPPARGARPRRRSRAAARPWRSLTNGCSRLLGHLLALVDRSR